MEELEAKKDKQLQINYRKTILNVKVVTINGLDYCISKLEDLQLCSSEKLWQKDGTNDFEATAEIFFVLTNGDTFSSGERLKISGKITKNGEIFHLNGALFVSGQNHINTRNFKLFVENEN